MGRHRDNPAGLRSRLDTGEHPATSGRLTGLRPLRPARGSFSSWLTGTWHADGTDVLVKVNATRRERFWMAAASRQAPGSVPHVFASDDALGPVGASWLVLERLPCTHDPRWGAAAFSSLLTAAARFQAFAATIDAAFRIPSPDPALLFDPIPRRQPWPFEPAYLDLAFIRLVRTPS